MSAPRLALLFVVTSLLVVGLYSPYALLSLLDDGLTAAAVIVPPMLAGLWLVPARALGGVPLRWHLLLGAALGLGTAALLVLLLGMAGMLARPLWVGLLFIAALLGLFRLRSLWRGSKADRESADDSETPNFRWWNLLWLLAVPCLSMGVVAAAHAPGLIWKEEGYGYDVLSYHLQLPREYVEAGHIGFMPHNVYGSFPANVEMLYLLAMIVRDDVVEAGPAANFIHLALAVLAVMAAWVIGREVSPAVGVVGAVALATTGWLAYLAGLAYVEHGLLFFGLVATGALLRGLSGGHEVQNGGIPELTPRQRRAWFLLAGVLAGLAAGCKYTAVPMIVLPLVAMVVCFHRGSWRPRLAAGLGLGLMAAVMMSPWLIKNFAATGNPVFPLANGLFQATPPEWGAEETERWQRGHALPEADRAAARRLTALWRHVPGDHLHRFGPAIFLLALLAMVPGSADGYRANQRQWETWALLLLAGGQLLVWLLATHLYARFAVVLLIPLCLLAGRAIGAGEATWRRAIVLVVLITGSIFNTWLIVQLHRHEGIGGGPPGWFVDGSVPGYEFYRVVNRDLPEDARVMLVGEARAFYVRRAVIYATAFNRQPLAAKVESGAGAEEIVDWLRDQGVTHLLVNWHEVRRLSATYGFSREINPALFEALRAAGLRRVPQNGTHDEAIADVEIYAVPP